MWFRVYCTLADNREPWRAAFDLQTWSRVVGEPANITKRFLAYMDSKINDMRVSTEISTTGKITYLVVDEYHALLEESKQVLSSTSMRSVRSTLGMNRKKMKDEIIGAYHPAKIEFQRPMFEKHFTLVMRDTSREETFQDAKIEVEKNKHQEILSYIHWLSTTPKWIEDGGIFLLGLGKFMQARPWDYDKRYTEPIDPGVSAKDTITAQIEAEALQCKN